MNSSVIREIAASQFDSAIFDRGGYYLAEINNIYRFYKRYEQIVAETFYLIEQATKIQMQNDPPPAMEINWTSSVKYEIKRSIEERERKSLSGLVPEVPSAIYQFSPLFNPEEALLRIEEEIQKIRQQFLTQFFIYPKLLPRSSSFGKQYAPLDRLDCARYAFLLIQENNAKPLIRSYNLSPLAFVPFLLNIEQTLPKWGYQPIVGPPQPNDLALYLTQGAQNPAFLAVYIGSGLVQSKWSSQDPHPVIHPLFECPYFDHRVVFYRKNDLTTPNEKLVN